MSSKIWQFVEKVLRNDAFCGIMPEIAAEKKGSRNPEVPADIVILFVLMSTDYMATVYADLIRKGKKTLAQVPKSLQKKVKALLAEDNK